MKPPYYQNDWATLYHGDSGPMVADMEAGAVDLVLTDPPYMTEHTHAKHFSSVVDRKALGFEGINAGQCVALAADWCRVSNGWAVFTCEWRFMNELQEAGHLIRFGIWRKRNGAPQFTGDRPGTGWEGVAVCHAPGKKKWNGGGRHGFWDVPNECNGTKHPTQKPVELFKRLAADFAPAGALILDPFAGSGTALVAAGLLGFRAIGIEAEEKWCQLAADRLEALRGGVKVKDIQGGQSTIFDLLPEG